MAKKICKTCGLDYYKGTCPRCTGPKIEYDTDESFSSPTTTNVQKSSKGKTRSFATRTAIDAAKTVDTYGQFLQIIGIILGAITIIGSFAIGENNGGVVLAGVILGVLIIIIMTVQGALFRMVSNYVIARLED